MQMNAAGNCKMRKPIIIIATKSGAVDPGPCCLGISAETCHSTRNLERSGLRRELIGLVYEALLINAWQTTIWSQRCPIIPSGRAFEPVRWLRRSLPCFGTVVDEVHSSLGKYLACALKNIRTILNLIRLKLLLY